MQEKALNPSENVKKELYALLEQIDVIQKQSLNSFDKPEIYERVIALLEQMDGKLHELNALYTSPTPDQSRAFQDLFFNVKKMVALMENLKLTPQEFKFQQPFVDAIDEMKANLHLV